MGPIGSSPPGGWHHRADGWRRPGADGWRWGVRGPGGNWAVLSDEQMSNKVGVEHQPGKRLLNRL